MQKKCQILLPHNSCHADGIYIVRDMDENSPRYRLCELHYKRAVKSHSVVLLEGPVLHG